MRKILQTEFGRTIVYDNGIAGGLPILYLHGGPGTSDPSKICGMAVPYTLYTYDQYGCGGSWKPKDPGIYSLELFVKQLREVILHLDLEARGFVLMGSSWGSFLACAYLEKYNSNHINGLILASPYLDDKFWQERVSKLISSLPTTEIRKEIKRCRADKICNEESALVNRGFYAEHYARNGPDFIADTDFLPNEEIFTTMMGPSDMISNGKLSDMNASRCLIDLDIPAILISGDYDISGPEKLFEYAAQMKNCKVEIIEDTGHIIDRRTVGNIVTKFMDSISIKDEIHGRYLWENDYDIIMDPNCTMKSPDHEREEAKIMTAKTCIERAESHMTGVGANISYYSAITFYEAAKDHISQPYYDNFLRVCEPFGTQYNCKDPHRKLIFSSRGAECICCEDMHSIIDSIEIDDGYDHPVLMRRCHIFDSTDMKEESLEISSCPFCSCNAEVIIPDQNYIDTESEYKDPDELLSLGLKYETDGSIMSMCIAKELYYKACDLCIPKDLKIKSENARVSSINMEKKLLKNITGVLTRSSVCFESICCKEFSENIQNIIPLKGGFYCDVELGNEWYHNLHSCPYCGAILKRVPRHY